MGGGGGVHKCLAVCMQEEGGVPSGAYKVKHGGGGGGGSRNLERMRM